MRFNNIALIAKYQSDNLTSHVIQLAEHLQDLGANIYIDCSTFCDYSAFSRLTAGCLSDWLEVLDLVIVVGGDGTLLSAARVIVSHDIPIIGVNQGRLGFMTDIAVNEMTEVIDSVVLNGQYSLEMRNLLVAKIIRENEVIADAIALNDVVISRGASGNMIEFDISIDGQFVLSQKSDGVIFATPTGSTAYSLAAGGPIMHPNTQAFAIVPICPQALTNRPFVVHDEAIIEFTLERENATQVHFDGQKSFDLRFHDQVHLAKYPKSLRLIHPHGYSYYSTLRQKLDWSKRVS